MILSISLHQSYSDPEKVVATMNRAGMSGLFALLARCQSWGRPYIMTSAWDNRNNLIREIFVDANIG